MRYSKNETEVVKNKNDLFYVFRELKINITEKYIVIKKEDKIVANILMEAFNNNPRHVFKAIIELTS